MDRAVPNKGTHITRQQKLVHTDSYMHNLYFTYVENNLNLEKWKPDSNNVTISQSRGQIARPFSLWYFALLLKRQHRHNGMLLLFSLVN